MWCSSVLKTSCPEMGIALCIYNSYVTQFLKIFWSLYSSLKRLMQHGLCFQFLKKPFIHRLYSRGFAFLYFGLHDTTQKVPWFFLELFFVGLKTCEENERLKLESCLAQLCMLLQQQHRFCCLFIDSCRKKHLLEGTSSDKICKHTFVLCL